MLVQMSGSFTCINHVYSSLVPYSRDFINVLRSQGGGSTIILPSRAHLVWEGTIVHRPPSQAFGRLQCHKLLTHIYIYIYIFCSKDVFTMGNRFLILQYQKVPNVISQTGSISGSILQYFSYLFKVPEVVLCIYKSSDSSLDAPRIPFVTGVPHYPKCLWARGLTKLQRYNVGSRKAYQRCACMLHIRFWSLSQCLPLFITAVACERWAAEGRSCWNTKC